MGKRGCVVLEFRKLQYFEPAGMSSACNLVPLDNEVPLKRFQGIGHAYTIVIVKKLIKI